MNRIVAQPLRHAVLMLFVVALGLVPGCGGCQWGKPKPLTPQQRQELAEAEAKEKAPLEKPDFEPPQVGALPDSVRCSVKPGHWIEIRQELKANNFDFVGDVSCSTVTRKNQAQTLERSPFIVASSRPAALIKGQTKVIDLPVYVARPAVHDGDLESIRLRPILHGRNAARVFEFGAMPTTLMRPHQFHFMILATNPDKYGFVRATSCVAPPSNDWSIAETSRVNYLVGAPNLDDGIPLPRSAMTWTTTAYVLWDDVDPDALSVDQQTAMLDWLHWGGQLIISGPRSVEQLRLGFLSEYLPITPGQMVNADAARIKRLDELWSLEPRNRRPGGQYQLADSGKPLQILELHLRPGARFIPNSSELVVEQRFGRGRIVVTAFALSDQAIVNWRSFDSFMNGCLLRRPPRVFSKGRDGFAVFAWKDILGRVQDPRLSSGLRYFTRDAAIEGLRQDSDGRALVVKARPNDAKLGFQVSGPLPKQRDGYRADPTCGIAAWNDFSSAAVAARCALVDAAGISVPNRRFVAKLMGIYLLLLVPVNWLIFRLARRVEWAWFAAPVIAVVGALAVIRLAQLDIGFVRSRTEIAVVETQADYTRAHLTRYTGLYTSLSTGYELEFEDSTAVALPFSTDPSDDELRLAPIQSVQFRQQKQANMRGMPILSNSTGLLHSEQLIDLEGPIALREDGKTATIENGTQWELRSAILLRRDGEQFRMTPLGTLEPFSVVPVDVVPVDDVAVDDVTVSSEQIYRFLEQSPITSYQPPKGEVSLRQLYRLALDARQLTDGGTRLVAWTDVELDGVKIKPGSNQRTSRVLVVSNLHFGNEREALPDANMVEDVKEKQSALFDPPES